MRTTSRILLAALAAAVAAAPAAAQTSPFDPHGLTAPPLNRLETVTPQRFVLSNGAVVFLLEDHTLPVVRGTAYFPSSPTLVADDRVGLDQLTGEVMRSGGTAAHPGDAMDDRLAALGATVSTSLSDDLGDGGFRCLSENAREVVGLFADVLRRPTFPDDKIELSKVGMRRAIAGRNDEMIPMLFRIGRQAVYGRTSPWAREPEYATIEPIARADCARLHDRVFVPERMVLAVYGDFRAAEMKRLLTAAFGDWKKSGTEAPKLPPAEPRPTPRLVFAPKDDVTETGLVLAGIGHRTDDPDHAGMEVFSQALGGGFASRLVNRIRTERGLAYGAGSAPGDDMRHPGVFFAYTLTRNDSAMTALALLRDEVARAVAGPFTDPEFQVARGAVQNAFVFNFEDRSQTLFRAAYYQVEGYPPDFLDRYQKMLAAVTPASMQEAARRKVDPAALVAIVVGKEKDFDRPLESFGLPVERVDIAIPPPPSKLAVGEATPEALAKGREWMARAASAAGGADAWAAVHAVATEQTMTVTMQGQSLEVGASAVWALPDRQVVTQKLPMMEMKQGFDGSVGWMSAMGQVQDQPRMGAEIKKEYEHSLFRMLGRGSDLVVQALPEPRTVDGVRYDVAVVKSELVRDWTVFFGPDGRIARMEYADQGPQGGPAHITQTYSDWKAVGALQYPHSQSMLVDGKPFMVAKVTSLRLDPPVDDAMFRKPQ